MYKLIFFFFLISCSSPSSNYILKNEILDFNKDLTPDEFSELLIKYVEKSPYPNID
tara:strand:- start:103 stop:270 length:168 start_codon:yes stop_codon:yes gene_type:complete